MSLHENGEIAECIGCGAAIGPEQWDPDSEGTTCGGLRVRGGFVCPCGKSYIGRGSKTAEQWKLAGGGRSVETGIGRIRVDGGDAVELMKRIVRLPELEKLERQVLAERAKSVQP